MLIIMILFTIINHKITKGAIMDTQLKKQMRAIEFLSSLFVCQDRIMDFDIVWQGYQILFNDKLTKDEFESVYNDTVFAFNATRKGGYNVGV